jgi:hypothetical protein
LPVTLARVARNRAMSDKNFPEHLPGHRDLGHPKRNVAAVADHLGADFDQLLRQAAVPRASTSPAAA